MATATWTGTATSGWSVTSNWTGGSGTGGSPGSGDDVLIHSAASAAYTITYDLSSLSINSLTLNDTHATLKWKSGTESLTVSGATTITLGTFNGFTGTSTFSTGSLAVNGGTFNPTAGSFTVTGQANFTGGTDTIAGGAFNVGTLTVGTSITQSGGTITTQSGGGGATVATGKTFTMSGASTVLDATNGGLVLTTTGIVKGVGIVKGAVSDTSSLGQLEASGGTLNFTGSVAANPSWVIDSTKANSDLKFSGTATDSQSLSLTSANQTLEIDSTGNVTLNKALSATNATILMDGGTLNDTLGLTLSTASTLKGSGTVNPTLATGVGTVRASGGTLELVQNLGASSGLIYTVGTVASSVLKIDGTVGSGNTVTFAGPENELNYANAAALKTTISALNVGSSATVPTSFIDISNHTVALSGTNSFTGTSGTLNLTDGSVLTLSGLTGSTGGTWFVDTKSDGGSGTDVFLSTAVCFLRGTRVLTVDGEVPVEDLNEGDLIVTASGATRPVKWIGKRGYVTRLVSQHQRDNVLPIRFVRGSLGEGLPKRDLFVSPEHMMFLNDVLIPARHLVNGSSIDYCDAFPVIEYFHVELPGHDVILAEGAAAESWLDTGNRNMFANVLEYRPRDDESQEQPCAPIVTEGPQLVAIRSQLQARIAATGFELIADPDLHLLADGKAVRGSRVSDTVYRFELDERPAKLAIASLVSVPGDVDPESTDRRPLGVCLKRIALKGAHASLEIAHDEPTLAEGYHGAEPGHRWTTGTATIPAQFLACLSGPLTIEVRLAAVNLRYARRATGAAVVIPLSGDRRDAAIAA